MAKPNFVLNLHPRLLKHCSNKRLAHGVIGNTPVFGTVIQGSSPCGPTKFKLNPDLFCCRDFVLGIGLGREACPERGRRESLWANSVLNPDTISIGIFYFIVIAEVINLVFNDTQNYWPSRYYLFALMLCKGPEERNKIVA